MKGVIDVVIVIVVLASTVASLGHLVATNPEEELRKQFDKLIKEAGTPGWRMWKLLILVFWVVLLWRFLSK